MSANGGGSFGARARQRRAIALKESLQLLSSMVVALSVCCYVLGLLIVNMSLARYGLFDAGLLRTDYVLAGVTYLGLVAVALFGLRAMAYNGQIAIGNWKAGARKGAIWSFIFNIAAFLMAFEYILVTISGQTLGWDSWRTWVTTLSLISAAYMFQQATDRVREMWRHAQSRRPFDLTKFHFGAYNALTYSPALLGVVALYAIYGYSQIEPAYGGGKKDDVILIPSKDGDAVLMRAQLPRAKGRAGYGPLAVAIESQSELAIVPDDLQWTVNKARVIRIDKKLIDAIVTVKPSPI